MPESLRRLLAKAENAVEPSEAFVERLSDELASVVAKTQPVRRARLPIILAVAAILVLVIGVVAYVVPGPDTPELTAEFDSSVPLVASDSEMPLSISRACDSFLVAVASVLRPGGSQQLVSSASNGGLSASSLYELRDQLRHIWDLYILHGEQEPLSDLGFSQAMTELSQAALFVQLGEFDQAEVHLATTRALISDLSNEPGLTGCLKL